MKRYFREELINRIDEIIPFRCLDREDVERILRKMLDEISLNLRDQYGMALRVSPEAEELIARKGFSVQYGVRELRRTVERLVLSPLSSLVLNGRFKKGGAWRVTAKDDLISIESEGKE